MQPGRCMCPGTLAAPSRRITWTLMVRHVLQRGVTFHNGGDGEDGDPGRSRLHSRRRAIPTACRVVAGTRPRGGGPWCWASDGLGILRQLQRKISVSDSLQLGGHDGRLGGRSTASPGHFRPQHSPGGMIRWSPEIYSEGPATRVDGLGPLHLAGRRARFALIAHDSKWRSP